MKVMIGIPVFGSVPGETFPGLLAQVAQVAKEHHVYISAPHNVVPYDRAREAVMAAAFDSGAELLYFLDDDMDVPLDAFERLLKTLEDRKASMVTGYYYRRGYPFTSVWAIKKEVNGEKSFFQVIATKGVYEIDTTGLGCCLVDLRWLGAHVKPPWFRIYEREDGTVMWEDCYFCKKIQEAGGLILGNADVRPGHLIAGILVSDKNADKLRKENLDV